MAASRRKATKPAEKPVSIFEEGGFDNKPEEEHNNTEVSIFEQNTESITASQPIEEGSKPRNENAVKGATSWKPDDWNEDTWNESNLLKVELRDKMYIPCWVREDNIARRSDEGYIFVNYSELANFNKLTLKDGEGLDSIVRRREMTLMKLRIDRHKAKQKYLNSLIQDPKQIRAKYEADVKAQGGEITGSMTVK